MFLRNVVDFELHGVTSQKIEIFITTAVTSSKYIKLILIPFRFILNISFNIRVVHERKPKQ
jgi:hypothetical protein